MTDQDRLVMFLYLLMRDELPTGSVVKLIGEIEELGNLDPEFSNKHLEAMARDYADRLLDNLG